ncbi:hypothetical protein CBD41_01645 [bacterium TMED181]|nr:hypothetical protein [Planctomycetota bacterium]OUW47086.1 MAG: hypothetical protein CBD41_01645 [bacterium TMED181]
MYDQPIVERKDSSPLGTSLLGVAAFCLIFASVMLCMSLKEFSLPNTSPTESASKFENELKKTQRKADKLFSGMELDG